MLSFDSSLTNRLNTANTECFFALKLYYNDETSFIGVSDQYILDGSDEYHGIVKSWGSLSQTADFFNFNTSVGNMSVTLMNTNDTIQNARFSDLMTSKNFSNRKWELFLCAKGLDTLDTSARMIGSGVISGDIKYDHISLKLTLLDKGSVYSKQIPSTLVDTTNYPNAPQENIGKPIPMSYGDFDRTSEEDYYKQFFTKNRFPAIITERCNDSGEIEALPDTNQGSAVILNQLRDANVYMVTDGNFLAAEDSNVTVTSNPSSSSHNIIKAKGTNYFYRLPLTNSFTEYDDYTNRENAVDDDLTSYASFDTGTIFENTHSGTYRADLTFNVPKTPRLGELYDNGDIAVIANTSNFSSISPGGVSVKLLSGGSLSPAITTDGVHKVVLSSKYSDDQLSSGSIDSTTITFRNELDTTQGDISLSYRLLDLWMRLEFRPNQIFRKKVDEQYETVVGYSVQTQFEQEDSVEETVIATRTKTLRTPADISYLYYSGKGREYGSWVDADSRNNGYNNGDLIENPIYMIEDAMRNELGLTSSNIDYDSFDTSGNTTNGYIGDILNDSVGDVKFAFSQFKFIKGKDFLARLGKQCFSWIFTSSSGKYKIRTLRRPTDYSASDKVIDFADMTFKSISKTSLNSIRNDITVHYNQNYGTDQFEENINVNDSTSSGSTVDGNNQELKLEIDLDVIDETTATAIANTYLAIFKDRKVILSFDLPTAYLDLEICDIVSFKDWDSNIKIYGDEMATDDYYMITKISKKPTGCSVEAIKVSE